jgi:chromosome segregation ATPase
VNKQRAATRAFTDQTAALNQKLTELGQAVGQTEEIAKQNLSLKKDVADLRAHLDALDAQLNQSKPAASPQPSPEDKW